METVHKLSPALALPEYDLYGVPPTQLIVDRDITTEHRPISVINDSSSPIQFEIHTAVDEYINLSKSEIKISMKISISKANLGTDKDVKKEDWDKICPVNNLLHSMFKAVKLTIGGAEVTSASNNYPYLSYIETLIHESPEAKRTYLESGFWHRDKTGSMDSINGVRNIRIKPTGVPLEDGCVFELKGNLHIDLAKQHKSLLGGVTIGVTLLPNDPNFYLLYDNTLVPKVTILEAKLLIHRAHVLPAVVLGHNKALEHANARYFITRREVKSMIIQKGQIDCY